MTSARPRTPPKGRPTPGRTLRSALTADAGVGRRRRLSANVQWALIAMLVAAVVIAAIVFGGGDGVPAHLRG